MKTNFPFKKLLFLISASLFINIAQGQQTKYICRTNEAGQESIGKDSSLILKRAQTELLIDHYIKSGSLRLNDNDSVRIIPVVFHIFHEGGHENISDSQVVNCIQVLNEDFRRKNADTINTPAAFVPVAADCKIEFRLATKDPNGNCTNGIDRIFTHRTNQFGDYTKSVSDWPADKYFNIWVAKSISGSNSSFTTIGYAQFPDDGPPETDGVVLQYSFVGKIGTGQPLYAGREATYEIGHYLNLFGIWGYTSCGSDSCDDTPPQAGPSYGCPFYPHISCSNAGDMSDNFMDASYGTCKDIFTHDQKLRMRATLDVVRFNLWQPANLIATGTDNAAHDSCMPVAGFLEGRTSNATANSIHLIVCLGSTVYFKDNSTNGIPTSWNWSFPGGNPSSSTLQNPVVIYNTPGSYHVVLTATNSSGSTVKDIGDAILVDNTNGIIVPPYSESFEGSQFPPQEWIVYNDDGGPAWQRTGRAAYTGDYCASVQNFETTTNTAPGSVKELVTPSFDFTRVTSAVVSFRISYGQQYSGNQDSLSFDISSNCSATWTEIGRYTSNALASLSGGMQDSDFAPTHAQWGLVSIPISNVYEGSKDIRFRFYFRTGLLSNNIYLDDFNVNGIVGIDPQENTMFSFNVDPNPANGSFLISYNLKHNENIAILLYDLQGRLVRQLATRQESGGVYQIREDASSLDLSSGIYLLKMSTPDGSVSRKLVYSAN